MIASHRNFRIKAVSRSDIGRRKNNEDACLVNEGAGIFIVADGMGGHEKGEVASWFAADNLEKIMTALKAVDGSGTLDDLLSDGSDENFDLMMQYAILATNKKLFEENEAIAMVEDLYASDAVEIEVRKAMAQRKKMGTTVVSMVVRDGRAYVANIGDSRAYRIAGGNISRLTVDHSWVEEKIRAGELTPEEARNHHKRNVITRTVGFREDVRADIEVVELKPPERFLLCSDGLSNAVDEGDLLEFCQMADMKLACDELVELALANGGRDNITAVLIDVTAAERPRTIDDATDI